MFEMPYPAALPVAPLVAPPVAPLVGFSGRCVASAIGTSPLASLAELPWQ